MWYASPLLRTTIKKESPKTKQFEMKRCGAANGVESPALK